jgi:hypothetical protein
MLTKDYKEETSSEIPNLKDLKGLGKTVNIYSTIHVLDLTEQQNVTATYIKYFSAILTCNKKFWEELFSYFSFTYVLSI